MGIERAINRPVTLYPTEIEIVRKHAEANGMNFSGAVRNIVRQWATMTGSGVYVSQLPAPADAQPVPVFTIESK